MYCTVTVTVSAVLGAVLLCLCSAAPVPELVIAEPRFYPHGRSNSNQPQQQQQEQQKARFQSQSASQSSYVPQIVKPPASMNMNHAQKQYSDYSGNSGSSRAMPSSFRRGAPFGDWGNDFLLPGDQDHDRDRDRDQERNQLNRDRDRNQYQNQNQNKARDNWEGDGDRGQTDYARDHRDRGSGTGNRNFPTLSSLSGYNSKRNQQLNSKLLIAKPLYHPHDKQGAKLLIAGRGEGEQRQQQQLEAQASVNSASSSSPSTSSNHVNVDASEHGAIEIPEMGGIEYYDLINHIRSWTGALVDATVKAPGNVATAAQTVVRGSSNLFAQVRENMPDIQLPELPFVSSMSIPSLTSLIPDLTQGEDSYVAASQMAPLAPFPDFIGTFMSSKKRPPVESHWLDNYGV